MFEIRYKKHKLHSEYQIIDGSKVVGRFLHLANAEKERSKLLDEWANEMRLQLAKGEAS